MGDLIDLAAIRKLKTINSDDKDFDKLCDRLDELIGDIDIQYKMEFDSDYEPMPGQHAIEEIEINPILAALYNSYYALLFEGREDLAELQLDIIKMV